MSQLESLVQHQLGVVNSFNDEVERSREELLQKTIETDAKQKLVLERELIIGHLKRELAAINARHEESLKEQENLKSELSQMKYSFFLYFFN
jgi:flagellar biosynthesis chaperone FliJ